MGQKYGGKNSEPMCRPSGKGGHACRWMYLPRLSFSRAGKPEKVRADHLAEIKTPCLILQGDRDPFGSKAELSSYRLSRAINIRFVADGEHTFIPRKSSGRTKAENWDFAVKELIQFISSID